MWDPAGTADSFFTAQAKHIYPIHVTLMLRLVKVRLVTTHCIILQSQFEYPAD